MLDLKRVGRLGLVVWIREN